VDLEIEYQQHEQIAPIISRKFRRLAPDLHAWSWSSLRMDVATFEWIVRHPYKGVCSTSFLRMARDSPEMPARLPNQSMRGGLLGEEDFTPRIAAVGGRVKDVPE
jgi:hypothetical protein